MVERTPFLNFFTHVILFVGFVFASLPFVIVVIAASHNLQDVNDVPMSLMPGSDFWINIEDGLDNGRSRPQAAQQLHHGGRRRRRQSHHLGAAPPSRSSISAIPAARLIFWLIFITLMLPLEVRIVPTYAVAANVLSPYQTILDITGITWLIEKVSGVQVTLNWGCSIPIPA